MASLIYEGVRQMRGGSEWWDMTWRLQSRPDFNLGQLVYDKGTCDSLSDSAPFRPPILVWGHHCQWAVATPLGHQKSLHLTKLVQWINITPKRDQRHVLFSMSTVHSICLWTHFVLSFYCILIHPSIFYTHFLLHSGLRGSAGAYPSCHGAKPK